GADSERFRVLMMQRSILIFRGDFEGSLERCRTALELAERTGDPDMIAAARGNAGLPLWTSGRLVEAVQSVRGSIGAGRNRPEWTKFPHVASSDQTEAYALLLLGYPDQAESANRAALEKVRRSGHGASATASEE